MQRRGRTLPVLAAAAAIALVLGGCGRDERSPYFGTTSRGKKDPRTFYTNLGAEPEYLDPGKLSDSASQTLALQLFEGLTKYDPRDSHPTLGVATRWEQSDDSRFYRFHLRDTARWSDGKPVTAKDFEYAWRRVLRPSVASRAAPTIYALKNAELYNRGLLLTTKRDVVVRAAADASSAEVARLAKGSAVRVVARSPLELSTDLPLFAAPAPAKVLVHKKADERTHAPEQISYEGLAKPVVVDASMHMKGAKVDVLGAGDAVDCDGESGRWLEVRAAGATGWAPTCMTREPGKKPPKRWLLVARHDALPTYDPATPSAEVPPAPAPIGFVDEDDVGDDASVVGVRATDDLTLDVELENPTPYFTDLTSSTALFPVRADVVEAFLARGQEDLWTRPESMISNGPFMLDTWRFRYEITMKPNPFYWNAKAIELDRIVWAEVEDYHATLNLYKAGDIDQIGDNVSLPSELQPRLRPYKDYKNDPILSVYWFELNTRRPPLDDARVRHALDLAIDKRQVVEKVTRGGQIPATHYVPDMTGLGYADEVADERAHGGDPFAAPERQFDPARARALLGEAGFPVVEENGELRATGMPPLELLYNTSEGHKQIAVAVQGMWKKNLGVSITLRNEEWRVMLKNFRDGNFQIMRFGWVAAYNHPSSFLETFASGTPQNTTGWGSAAFDDALHAAGREPDRAKSMKLYREAERIAVDAMPRIPLYFYTKSTLVKPWVRGHWGTPRNLHLYEYFWIDPDWAKGAPNAPAFAPFEPPPPGRLGAPLDAGTPEPP